MALMAKRRMGRFVGLPAKDLLIEICGPLGVVRVDLKMYYACHRRPFLSASAWISVHASLYNCRPPYAGIGKNIVFVATARREFRDNGPVVAGLEPVQRIGRDCMLLPWMQHNLVPGRVGVLAPSRQPCLRVRGSLSIDIEINDTLATTEGLFLARRFPDGRVPVFRAGLAREKNEFFRAHALGIDVNHQLQAGRFQFAQTKVRYLDSIAFRGGQHDAGALQAIRSRAAELRGVSAW